MITLVIHSGFTKVSLELAGSSVFSEEFLMISKVILIHKDVAWSQI